MLKQRLKKLGIEKSKVLTEKFDEIYEKYKNKALETGNAGELKFIKEHGNVIIYVIIDLEK